MGPWGPAPRVPGLARFGSEVGQTPCLLPLRGAASLSPHTPYGAGMPGKSRDTRM